MTTLEILKQLKAQTKKYILFIGLVSGIFATIVGFYVKSIEGKFETYSKIFPLSINSSGGGSPFDAIKAQFGISDKTDYDKIYNVNELVTSKTLSESIVKRPIQSKKFKTLADWLLEDYNKHVGKFKKKLVFGVKDTNQFYLTAASILLGNIEVVSEKTDFTKIVTKAYDKELAKEMNTATLDALSSFYIQMSTEKPTTEVNKLHFLSDSLKNELYSVERSIAGIQDQSMLVARPSANIPQAKLLRVRAEIEELYATSVTALQNARFKLLSQSPIFQVLDYPGEPYNYIKPSTLKAASITFLLSIFILILFVNRKIFSRIIIEELSKV